MSENQSRGQAAADEIDLSQIILTPGQMVIRRFFRNRLAIVGLVILLAMALFCFVGPILCEFTETDLFYINEITGEFVNMQDHEALKQPGVVLIVRGPMSWEHPFGTDNNGNDVFVRLMYGGRRSLVIGFVVVGVEMLIGVTLGCVAGYYGRKVDMIIMRLVEVFSSIPFIPLMLITSSMLIAFKISPEKKIYYTMFILGFLSWSGAARMVRGNILSLREMEFMKAAEATGIPARRKLFNHLVPNVMPIIIVMATMGLGETILTESVMSFLGIGVPAPFASWGNMVEAVNTAAIFANYIYIWLPPGMCILVTVLAFNFVGDGLRDAFDPKMKL